MPKGSKTTKEIAKIDSRLSLMWAMMEARWEVDRRATVKFTIALAIGSALIAADMGLFLTVADDVQHVWTAVGLFAVLAFELWLIGFHLPVRIENVRKDEEIDALVKVMRKANESGLLDPLITESGLSLPFGDRETEKKV